MFKLNHSNILLSGNSSYFMVIESTVEGHALVMHLIYHWATSYVQYVCIPHTKRFSCAMSKQCNWTIKHTLYFIIFVPGIGCYRAAQAVCLSVCLSCHSAEKCNSTLVATKIFIYVCQSKEVGFSMWVATHPTIFKSVYQRKLVTTGISMTYTLEILKIQQVQQTGLSLQLALQTTIFSTMFDRS